MKQQAFIWVFMGVVVMGVSGLICRAWGAEPKLDRTEFLKLCDQACGELSKEITPFREEYRKQPDPKTHHVPFFEDAYVARALCVAYDMTGKKEYLDTCTRWADRVVELQDTMAPKGAYYLNYYREPGKNEGDWFVADSGSVAMGILATEARCADQAKKAKYLDSLKAFASLVIGNYVGKEGGITDGIWSGFDGEWWCSTATFGAFLFLLYDATGDAQYLKPALAAMGWMTRHDFRKAEHISFEESAPCVVFYCFEFYAAGIRFLPEGAVRQGALGQIGEGLRWMGENQRGRGANTKWNYESEATYMGGMPYLMYVFARQLPEQKGLGDEADKELRYLYGLLFNNGEPPLCQLTTWELASWTMMSYAEKLQPGGLFRK